MSRLIYNSPLYHGRPDYVKYPSVSASNVNCDFGPGFYCTTNSTQAKQWGYTKILRDPRRPTYAVSEYRFKPDQYITLNYPGAVQPRLDIQKINSLFESLSGLVADKQIDFYKIMAKARKEMILEPAYTKLRQRENKKV